MDISRPEFKVQKRRRQTIRVTTIVLCVVLVSVGVSRMKPPAPAVDRSAILTDTVKRGSIVRQVRGLGSLVPSQDAIRQIPAETDATVLAIHVLPGSHVKSDTILLEMSNPQTEQSAVDAQLQFKAALAEYQSLRVKLESELMDEKARAATVGADHAQVHRQAETDKALYELGVISGLSYKSSREKAEELNVRNELERQRIAASQRAIDSQMAQEEAKVEQMRTLARLKEKQCDALRVRPGIDGVLVDLPLQVGQRVSTGTMLAKVVRPDRLIATLKIAESQARDVQVGQPAFIDTHTGTVLGTVMRVDPAVQNGTVTVDVKLQGDLPKGARPDLSIDGTIDLERLDNVLYVGRPALGQENGNISFFRLSEDGKRAARVTAKVGRASVNSIQIIEGLREGDTIILSDMSRWDNAEQIRIE